MKKSKTLILAAGQGTRMHSKKPKVLHQVCGKNILNYVIQASQGAGIEETAVIVGYQADLVKASLEKRIETILQREQKGTGHAVMTALPFFEALEGNLIVLVGDAPFIRSETIAGLIKKHEEKNYAATVLTAEFENPSGYGRMVKNKAGELLGIVEEKDASTFEKTIKEINSGMYCFNAQILKKALKKIGTDNAQAEYYLTDVIEIMGQMAYQTGTYQVEDLDDIRAINTKLQLAEAEEVMRKRINSRLMEKGAILIDPKTTYIGDEVVIGEDSIILPGCILEGQTIIGEDALIGPNSKLKNAIIGDRVQLENATVLDSSIDNDSKIGPYAYIRPGCQIGKHCKVGDFVEVKNSKMADYSKAAHLTYVGDGDVGERVNLGCGTVFVNYDGKKKHRTIVEEGAFIGCNTNLIAPVTVKQGAYIAAGSTITEEVPEDSLAIARSRQINKVGYLVKKRNKEGK